MDNAKTAYNTKKARREELDTALAGIDAEIAAATDNVSKQKLEMNKAEWTTEVGTLGDDALNSLKGTMDSTMDTFKTAEADLKETNLAAEKVKLDAAFSGLETDKNDSQTAFAAIEGQLEYWADAKKKSKTEKEWEENHYKYMELEGEFKKAKKTRDDALATFNEANTAKGLRDAKATRDTAVADRKTAITGRATDITDKEAEIATAEQAATDAGDDPATDATVIQKKQELVVLQDAQKQDQQLNLEQDAVDAAAEREAQKTAFDTLETGLTTLNDEMATQETQLAELSEMMANA